MIAALTAVKVAGMIRQKVGVRRRETRHILVEQALSLIHIYTMTRYKRMQGYETYFLTGSDEHGQKIERAAKASGVTPLEYTDQIVASFQALWQRLLISNDDFIRTTEPRHMEVVQPVSYTHLNKYHPCFFPSLLRSFFTLL